MMKQITVQQLIEKLKVLDPNKTFNIQCQAYYENENYNNVMWTQSVHLDRNLFGRFKDNEYFPEENFDKVFITKDKYYDIVYNIINDYDFGYVGQYSDDEYSGEVKIIIQRLPKCQTIEDIQQMLYQLFTEYFSKNLIEQNQNLYYEAAKKLYNLEVIE